MIDIKSRIWIGIKKHGIGGTYNQTNGGKNIELNSTLWKDKEPSSPGIPGEECIYAEKNTCELGDMICTAELPFICHIKPKI